MSQELLIVAPFTSGTPYAEEVRELAAGAAPLGYRVEPIEIPDQGHWLLNVCVKPKYIWDVFRQHSGPMLILDADCRILKPLDELLALADEVDVAIKYRRGFSFTALFNVGVILLGATPLARRLVESWAVRTERYGLFHRFPDQATFTEAILDLQRELRFRALPLKFHVEPRDVDKIAEPERVIFHHKSSRAQRNANPQARPTPTSPIGPPEDVGVVALGPKLANPAAGLPLCGWDGAKADFHEYAMRCGVKKFWQFGIPVAPDDRAALEHCRLFAWSDLSRRFPPESRVLIADTEIVLMHNPRPVYAPLAEADVVVAWDSGQEESLPDARLIGLRMTPAVVETLLPRIEQAYERLKPRIGPELGLRRALADGLRSCESSVHTVVLPKDTICNLAEASLRTFAVAARGEPVCCTGDRTWHRPSFLRHPKTSPASQTFTV